MFLESFLSINFNGGYMRKVILICLVLFCSACSTGGFVQVGFFPVNAVEDKKMLTPIGNTEGAIETVNAKRRY
jgi:hypothetical protein